MKLATLNNGRPDGQLVVVSRDLMRFVSAGRIAPSLQAALDDWGNAAPALDDLSRQLDAGAIAGQAFDHAGALAPLPRAFQWIDGSSYLSHLERVRTLRGDPAPGLESARPLLYQGRSDGLGAPRAPILVGSDDLAVDFEAEIAVVVGAVPMGATREEAAAAIRLVMLCNDVSLRRLVAEDIENGLGFFHSKPLTAFAPVAATPLALRGMWRETRLRLPVSVAINGTLFGRPDAGADVHFDFADLIVEAARHRDLGCGTIVGSGAISNRHEETPPIKPGGLGFASIAEARTVEKIRYGRARTPYLKSGDTVRIFAQDSSGHSVFGEIEQTVRVPAD